ncbi:MAG: hypothetical protein ACE5JX_03420 [Acidobacteriota bacterium]
MSRYIAIFSSDPTSMLTLAQSLSPRVEVHATGGILLEVPPRYERPTLDRLLQLTAACGRLDFGAASTRTVALLAGRARPGSQVPAEEEKAFLAPFPVQLLSLAGGEIGNDLLDTFARWGIRTLGQLAQLPESELVARFGPPGLRLQQLARGEDILPFQPLMEKPRFQERQQLEWELDELEPLAFILGGLLDRLCRSLHHHGLATDCLQIGLRLSGGGFYERSYRLAFPMRNPKVLLSLLRLKLQSDPPGAAITAVSLEAHPARPQVFQYSLLEPSGPSPEDFSRTMARLTALIGEKDLGSPVVLDTHRPDARDLTSFTPLERRRKRAGGRGPRTPPSGGSDPRLAECGEKEAGWKRKSQLVLRRIRPPLPTSIHTHQIVACSGPWRSSGEWWEEPSAAGNPNGGRSRSSPLGSRAGRGWSHEEWDVELTDGRICRIYWDRRRKSWFLEGIYD